MQLPRHSPLFLAVGALLFTHPAEAAKSTKPWPREVHRIAGGTLLEGALPNCTMGVSGTPGSIIDFIYPPDDVYYTLVETNDCAACATADTAIFTKVHLWLEYREACELPISIGLVGAVESGTAGCYTPNLTDVRYGPEGFLIPPPAQVPDTVELVFTLSSTAVVDHRAFLAISFIDTAAGCIKPRLVMRLNPPSAPCQQCIGYNDWFGADDIPDDLCFPDQVGNPMMFVEVDTCYPLRDLVAPAAVNDLDRDSTAYDAVRLTWTAPGDDGMTGTATWYEVRRAMFPIIDVNFALADSIAGAPTPAVAGSAERFLVGGLDEMTDYWFALKAHDEGGNAGALSNVLAVTTPPGIPDPVGSLEVVSTTKSTIRLSWIATGDDGNVGRPLRYLIAVSTSPITAGNFYASLRDSVPPTVDPGGLENIELTGLAASTSYVIAVRARDELGNESSVVTVSGRTQTGGPPLNGAPAIAPLEQPSKLPVPLYWIGTQGEPHQKIRIYDLTGRLVRTLPLSSDPNGITAWDGLDDDGGDVPAGMYIAKLTTGSRVAKSRIVLLK
jgi:hypothetical protein